MCGPAPQPCNLAMSSIVRAHLAEGSSITSVANHAQSQLSAKSASRWAARLAGTLGRNFTHGAFMVPHDASWMEAQCAKYRTGVMPDPDQVGDRVEPCGDGDDGGCASKDPRFSAVSQWVTRPMAIVLRPSSTTDDIPNTAGREHIMKLKTVPTAPLSCVTDEQLATAACGGRRNSTVWLSQGFLPELQAAEQVDCSCGGHLCAGKCTETDGGLGCSPGEGMGAAWLVLRAAGVYD